MSDRFHLAEPLPVETPPVEQGRLFHNADDAVAALTRLYDTSVDFLLHSFDTVLKDGSADRRYRAFYPEIALTTTGHTRIDSRLSFGFVSGPGHYATTITRPDLFGDYLHKQIEQLIHNHGQPLRIGHSDTPIPLHLSLIHI